jgi:hypothetical protein
MNNAEIMGIAAPQEPSALCARGLTGKMNW